MPEAEVLVPLDELLEADELLPELELDDELLAGALAKAKTLKCVIVKVALPPLMLGMMTSVLPLDSL